MEEVRTLMHSDDLTLRQHRAPKKAKDTVRMMQKWMKKEDLVATAAATKDTTNTRKHETTASSSFRTYQFSWVLRGYNLWIHAIAKSGHPEAGYFADQVLAEMQHQAEEGGTTGEEGSSIYRLPGPFPNEITLAAVMDAHAQSSSSSSSSSSVSPSLLASSNWGASSSNAIAAETILFDLLERYTEKEEEEEEGRKEDTNESSSSSNSNSSSSIPPSPSWAASLAHTHANTSNEDTPSSSLSSSSSSPSQETIILTCDTMLTALAKEGTVESAQRAQLILSQLEDYQRHQQQQQYHRRRKTTGRSSSSSSPLTKSIATASSSTTTRPISYATGTYY